MPVQKYHQVFQTKTIIHLYRLLILQQSIALIIEKMQVKILNIKKDARYKVYPNPVKNVLNIEIVETSKTGKISLYDCFGRKILSKNINTQKLSLDISFLSKGMYFMEILDNDKTVKKVKIIKQ